VFSFPSQYLEVPGTAVPTSRGMPRGAKFSTTTVVRPYNVLDYPGLPGCWFAGTAVLYKQVPSSKFSTKFSILHGTEWTEKSRSTQALSRKVIDLQL
jgi:hypothetical protein